MPEDELVALSAAAEYALGRIDVPHSRLCDIASEASLASVQQGYWPEQVAWLEELERYVVSISPTLRGTGLRPVVTAGYMIKALVDPVFVRAFECDALTRRGWTEIEHHLRSGDPGLLNEVLPEFCRSRGVAYVAADASAPTAAPDTGTGRACLSLGSLGARVRFEAVVRARPPRVSDGADTAGLSLLLLSTFYDLTGLLQRNRERGGRTVVVENGRFVELGALRRRTLAVIHGPTARDREEWRRVGQSLRGEPALRRWPGSWFDGQVEELVMHRVAEWFENVMPQVVANARGFAEVFASERFDALVAPFVAHPVEVGAFAAARANGGPTSVVIEHGDTAHAAPSWDFELRASDVRFVPNTELAVYFRERARLYPSGGAVPELGSYRWRRTAALPARRPRFPIRSLIRGQSPMRSVPAAFDGAKPVLVYLVTLIAGDGRYLNNAWYPDAWYFGLQRAIVDTLAKHTQFNVIVKHFPGSTLDDGAIAEHVADLSVPHVMTSTAPFSRWLPWTDRVVADIASTGLYEALVAGRPSLGLLWKHHVARPGAIEALGPALVPFETTEDAAAAVDRFASSPSPVLPDLRPEGADILETLARLISDDPTR